MKELAQGLPFRSLDEEIAHGIITSQTESEKDMPSNHGLIWQDSWRNSTDTLGWEMTSTSLFCFLGLEMFFLLRQALCRTTRYMQLYTLLHRMAMLPSQG